MSEPGVQPEFDCLAVIGVGLIGGSFALDARTHGLVGRTIGVSRSRQSRDTCLERGIVDAFTHDRAEAVAQADLVFIAAPVGATGEIMREIAPAVRPEAVVTDAGSTKVRVMTCAREHLAGRCAFVGGHPMAGSEQSGPGAARHGLFRGRTYVLTPDPDTPGDAVARLARLVEALGSTVVVCGAEEHDRIVGATSHLPHLVAAALAGSLAHAGLDPEQVRLLSGKGLRDSTRIAAGEPELWSDIFSENLANLRGPLDLLRERLAAMLEAIEMQDEARLQALLAEAAAFRKGLD